MALTVGITVCIPAFADAVSTRILREEYSRGFYHPNLALFYIRVVAYPSYSYPIATVEAAVARDWMGEMMRRGLRLPIEVASIEMESGEYRLAPRAGDELYTSEHLETVRVRWVENVGKHVQVPVGMPFGQAQDDDVLDVWVTKSFLDRLAIQIGEEYELGDTYSSYGESIPIRIAGYWEAIDPLDPFWHAPFKSQYDRTLLTSADLFEQYISSTLGEQSRSVSWHYVFEDQRANLSLAERYIAEIERFGEEISPRLPGGRIEVSPIRRLEYGQERKAALSFVLFGFSLLLLGFLVYFLASLSALQARYQEGEIAMLVGRGSTPRQLVALAGAESLMLMAASIPAGVAVGLALAYLLGYSHGFLSFVARDPVQVSVYSVNWLPVIAVVAVNLIVRLNAAWRAGRFNVVTHEQKKSRQRLLPGVTRLTFVLLVSAVTVYAYRQLDLRGTLALVSLETFDPLTLLAPTLFLFSAPLVAVELFAVFVRLLGLIGRFSPWISTYLTSVNLARDGAHHRMSVYILILSLSMGIFYASLAKSADTWLLDSKRYEYGADLTFTVGVTSDLAGNPVPPVDPGDIPSVPASEYRAIPGISSASRVSGFRGALHGVRDVPPIRLLAVDRLDFAQAAYFRWDYAQASLGELMNRLAQTPEAILVPSDIADRLSLEIGDDLRVNVYIYERTLIPVDFRIVGLFDHFPTMYPDGAPILVTNLDFLEIRTVGILPYDMWLRLEPAAQTESVMNDVRQLNVFPGFINDLSKALDIENRRLERVGIFGMLSLCFVAGSILAVANLLVSSTMMLHKRSISYAVLQALGLQRATVLETVALEGLVSFAYGLVAGVVCGVLCARLYVPYFPLTDSPGLPVPPFIPVVDWNWTVWIAVSVTGALVLAQLVALVRLIRARIFEALRMGNRP